MFKDRNTGAGFTLALTLLLASLLPGTSAYAEQSTDARDLPAVTTLGDVWINDVGTLLELDNDGDRSFSRFSVSVDADVRQRFEDEFSFPFDEAFVFIRVALIDSIGVEQLLFDSRNFEVFGRSGGDRITIEFDLLTAIPQDRYDIVIELRDARDGELQDIVDPGVFRILGGLPLEDASLDGRIVDDGSVSFATAEFSSGAAGPWLLLLAGMMLGGRRLHRRSHT